MKMSRVYEEMKKAIEIFGLRFHQMDLIETRIQGNWLYFEFEDNLFAVQIVQGDTRAIDQVPAAPPAS